jgi:D-sedoheptulose 7-phosphate isomerase
MSRSIEDLVRRLPVLLSCVDRMEASIAVLATSLRNGGKVLVCGNGGSAADSEHLVADLMKGFMRPRPLSAADGNRLRQVAGERGEEIASSLQGGFAALALGTGGALATAISNDIAFDMVFAQQVSVLAKRGDVLVAISTTGNSPNVVNAAHVARLREMSVVALTGRDGGELADLADVAICVPADRVFEIQELHLPVYHAVALALEQTLFPS